MNELPYGFVDIEYEDGKGYVSIPSIVMGGGNVHVTDLMEDAEGFVGIGFSPLDEPVEIGAATIPEEGDTAVSIGCKNLLLFDNVASIDVVINQLKSIRERLTRKAEL